MVDEGTGRTGWSEMMGDCALDGDLGRRKRHPRGDDEIG